MSNNFIFRMPLKLPHQTFGEEFVFEELRLDNARAAHFILVSGDRVGQETGTAKITFDVVLKDQSIIAGIPFYKKAEDKIRYEEVKEDEIKLEDCPVFREYMMTDRIIAKYDADKIRLNISAIEDALTPCCIIIEGTDFRYASETQFSENHSHDEHNNGSANNQGGNQNGGGDTGTGDETGGGDGTGSGDDSGTGDDTGTGDGAGGGDDVNP